jgi:hypothetical protein
MSVEEQFRLRSQVGMDARFATALPSNGYDEVISRGTKARVREQVLIHANVRT